jgi:hypothetical protein
MVIAMLVLMRNGGNIDREDLYIKIDEESGAISMVTRAEVTDEELQKGLARPYMSLMYANHQGIINNLIGMGRAMAH